MSKISAKDVKKLRDTTGAGMMDCKKALQEADGDFDAAIEYLRKKGQKMSAKRADREANEGVVIALTSEDQTQGIIVKLSCETDFVAKNEDFINLAKAIAATALESFPESADELLQEEVNGEKIAEVIVKQTGVIGEKLEVGAYEKLSAPMVLSYIHMGYRAGVLVGLNKADASFEQAGRDVAMQVAAMRPIAVDESGVPDEVKAKELEIGREQALREGKPEKIVDRIAEGKLNKYYQENTLTAQAFVKDNKKSVAEYLKSVNKELKVQDFRHVELG